jgi:hypothetical protein
VRTQTMSEWICSYSPHCEYAFVRVQKAAKYCKEVYQNAGYRVKVVWLDIYGDHAIDVETLATVLLTSKFPIFIFAFVTASSDQRNRD